MIQHGHGTTEVFSLNECMVIGGFDMRVLRPWCRGEEGLEQARLEGGEKAVELREATVKPLRAEVARMRAALADLQLAYTSDIAQVSIPSLSLVSCNAQIRDMQQLTG